jgi:hypothetical protein
VNVAMAVTTVMVARDQIRSALILVPKFPV